MRDRSATDQEHKNMKNDGVEEYDGASHLVTHDETTLDTTQYQ